MSETHHGSRTEEEEQRRRMREGGCEPLEHEGPINVRVTMGEEVQVDKFCAACNTDVEGWSYDPSVVAVELELEDGRSERFRADNGAKNDQ